MVWRSEETFEYHLRAGQIRLVGAGPGREPRFIFRRIDADGIGAVAIAGAAPLSGAFRAACRDGELAFLPSLSDRPPLTAASAADWRADADPQSRWPGSRGRAADDRGSRRPRRDAGSDRQRISRRGVDHQPGRRPFQRGAANAGSASTAPGTG